MPAHRLSDVANEMGRSKGTCQHCGSKPSHVQLLTHPDAHAAVLP